MYRSLKKKLHYPLTRDVYFSAMLPPSYPTGTTKESILLFKEEYILESFPKDVLRQHTLPQKSKETIALIVK